MVPEARGVSPQTGPSKLASLWHLHGHCRKAPATQSLPADGLTWYYGPPYAERYAGVDQQVSHRTASLRDRDDRVQPPWGFFSTDSRLDLDRLKMRAHVGFPKQAAAVEGICGVEVDAGIGETDLSGGALKGYRAAPAQGAYDGLERRRCTSAATAANRFVGRQGMAVSGADDGPHPLGVACA